MESTLRSTLMRLALIAAAAALLLRAMLFERADLPYAIWIMAAALIYEALYHLASHAIRVPYAAQVAPSA